MTTPTPEELTSLAESQMRSDLRALATEINKQISGATSGGPFVKGIVSAVDWNSTPPLVTVYVGGDTTTPIAGVRVASNYTPVAGQTVLLLKQGPNLLAVTHIADQYGFNQDGGNGWIRATLSNGSHDGNLNGDVYYRRVLDHGSWKMQWRGGWAPGGSTTMISTTDALAEEYRPTAKRSVLTARHIQTGAVAVQFDFQTTGAVNLVGGTVSLGGADGTTATGGADNHTHNLDASHVHAPSAPEWVSLHNLEYFL